MNANHARPMLAFWLLALVAAVITSVGLRAGGTEVPVRAGSPSPVTRSGSPELVLGGLLRGVPSASATPTGTWGSASALEYAARQATGRPTTRATVAAPKAGVPTDSSAVASARATTTSSPGKSHDKQSGSGPGAGSTTTTTTATTTPTTTPTDSGHGNGQGSGHAPTDPGKSAGH